MKQKRSLCPNCSDGYRHGRLACLGAVDTSQYGWEIGSWIEICSCEKSECRREQALDVKRLRSANRSKKPSKEQGREV